MVLNMTSQNGMKQNTQYQSTIKHYQQQSKFVGFCSKSASGKETEDDDCFEYTCGAVAPYECDPVESRDSGSSTEDFEDEDRISREELEQRYERHISVGSW